MAQAKRDFITRRAILSGVAVLPAVTIRAVPAPAIVLAPAPDPIFAVIADHIRAYDQFIAILDDLAIAEQAAWHAPRGQRRAAKRRLAEARAAEQRFSYRESDAVERFVATVPQMLQQGVLAALRYARARHDEEHPMWDDDCATTFLVSIEAAICRALDAGCHQA
ncbi:MAG: hypothetical protein QOF14_3433 [Hyphomicrobiales bacterium]|jgi:hypothetical protein|nr:hypothetical protein [Hyphomicrobiales bacterium]